MGFKIEWPIFIALSCLIACGDSSTEDLPGAPTAAKSLATEASVVPTSPARPLKTPPAFATVSFQRELDRNLEAELVKSKDLHLFQNGQSFPVMMEVLRKAQKFFFLNMLSVSCDESTEPFIRLLEAKAQGKTDVRVITNTAFYYINYTCMQRLKLAGVKILKARTHSSYLVNDQEELLIGSQVVARMTFLSDGLNGWNRDAMLYAKGPLFTDAVKDFLSIWDEAAPEDGLKSLKEWTRMQKLAERKQGLRGPVLYAALPNQTDLLCRFAVERPSVGRQEIQKIWAKLVDSSEKKITFSGVRVQVNEGSLGRTLKEKSNRGVDVIYLGNGYLSGNGELTMIFNEWIEALHHSAFGILSSALESIRDWDRLRVVRGHQDQYRQLMAGSNIQVWPYFNFIHYKIWSFDDLGTFFGSANLDESKWGEVNEAGVFCLDQNMAQDVQLNISKDLKNANRYR
jgi:phosphatidylserine/phosphatidylglycerophosphate/cardiolipin synthase-like enzyme